MKSMNSMKKMLSIASAAFVLLAGLGIAGPASAQTASSTTSDFVAVAPSYTLDAPTVGTAEEALTTNAVAVTYEYNCVNTTGASYFMAAGQNLTDCHGSRLQKYLNGSLLKTYTLSYGGGAASSDPTNGLGCAIAIGGGLAILVLNPPTSVASWVLNGVVFGNSLISCRA
ncbi:hypothetical protein E3T61_09840 [Cryobacterium lactosi]|uniref:Uncharacterized protein n=1 Tax=Cryobacterium lactosi TaxID=1259202 RepID=A0A4R9BTR2_9MICO|nr:hypothetical protein [Cryobacterium lactosi]TFD90805.1 hypothetical protein E3T61_09840 [Cryobacterium lactosi]